MPAFFVSPPRGVIFAILAFCFVLCQFLRSSLAVVAPEMVREVPLTPRDLGLITSTFFFAVAAMQIPAGMMFDRYGVRLTAGIALVLGVIGGFVFAYGHSFWAFAIGQALLGLGTAPVFMGSIMVIGRWWEPQRFAAMSATMMSIGYLGNLAATTPLAYAAELIGWRHSLAVIAVGLAVSTVLILAVVRDAPPGHAWWQPRRPESFAAVFGGVREVLRHPIIPGLFAASFIGYSTSYAVRGLWVGPYMLEVHQLDAITRGNILFLFAALGTLGIFFSGQWAGKLGTPRPVVIGFAGITAATLVVMAAVAGPSVPFFVAVCAAFSLLANFYPAVLAHGQATFPDRLRGRALTTVNFAVFAGVGVTQVVTGFLINAFPADAVGAHPEAAYRLMFAYLAAVVIAGVAIYAVNAKFKRPAARPAGE
ncbi:MAG: MFS transporter [Reyranellaceae bacterium]